MAVLNAGLDIEPAPRHYGRIRRRDPRRAGANRNQACLERSAMRTIGPAVLTNWVPFASYDGAFSPDECDRVDRMGENWSAGTVRGSEVDPTLRDSRVSWISPSDENTWLYDKLAYYIESVNSHRYRFDLTGFTEQLQLTEYGPNEFYNWHIDLGNAANSVRKLSFVLQLSDENAYKSGDLEIFTHGEHPIKAPRRQGTLIFFPSYMLHRVAPLEEGTRRSLVGWVGGPPLR